MVPDNNKEIIKNPNQISYNNNISLEELKNYEETSTQET